MKLLLGRRRTGKTTKLVEEVKKDPHGIYIGADQKRVEYVRKTFDLPREKAYSYSTWANGQLRGRQLNGKNPNFYIDDYNEQIHHWKHSNIVTVVMHDDSIVWGSKDLEIKL